MSQCPLSNAELSLLSKGLNFCPTKHFDSFSTILDVHKFVHLLTLKKHYFGGNKDDVASSNDVPAVDESPPSSCMVSEVCALHDLVDLAFESDL